MLGKKVIIVLVFVDFKTVPVVQAGAPEVLLVQAESQGMHQVQDTSGCTAGAADVACVLGNLRLEKDDVDLHCAYHSTRTRCLSFPYTNSFYLITFINLAEEVGFEPTHLLQPTDFRAYRQFIQYCVAVCASLHRIHLVPDDADQPS